MVKTLTKKELKGVVVEALEPFARTVHSEFQRVHKRLDRTDGQLEKIEHRTDSSDNHLEQVATEVREMRQNASALFTKLDRFIAIYEKQEHELLILSNQVKKLEERIVRLEGAEAKR